MKTPNQRGTFGNWLHAERTRRYRRQADALADMRRLAGLNISESEFAQWESGSRVPREDNPKVARLYEFFGSQPSDTQQVPITTTGLEGLQAVFELQVVELRRQADATADLVNELRAERVERAMLRAERDALAEQVSALEQATQVLAARLAGLEATGPAGRRAPRAIAGSDH